MMTKNHEIYIFWTNVILSFCHTLFCNLTVARSGKNRLFHTENFILIYSLSRGLEIINKFILFNVSALVHLLLESYGPKLIG